VTASAYLSVFDDWSLLGPAVASIAPRVDEIVVVDGAYDWLAPYFAATGRDPARSDERVLDALAPFAAKLRWIHRTWKDEPHKRAAGYEACRHRHVFRIDADEALFFDDAQLDAYFAGSRPVAEMEMPIYVAPGFIRRRAGERIERQCMLFDRDRIGAREHLDYLWLELSDAERADLGTPHATRIHPEPIAFCAHLTHWRWPASSINRARFYILKALREGKPVAWAASGDGTQADVAKLVAAVPPAVMDDFLLGSRIVAGPPDMAGWELSPTPLSPAQEASFAPSYDVFLADLAALNAAMAHRPRTLMSGDPALFDVSTPAATAPFGTGDTLHVHFSEPLSAIGASLHSLLPSAPWQRDERLVVTAADRHASVRLPPAEDALRRTLRLGAQVRSLAPWLHMSAGPP